MKKILAGLAVLLWGMGLASSAVASENNLTAAQHFEIGAKLIENNHYDAMGSTNEGLATGISHVKEALSMGYPDKKRAYLMLIDSYGQWPKHPEWGSDADKELLKERNHYLQLLYQNAPNDQEVLTRYAEMAPSKEDQIRAYKQLIELSPKLSIPHANISLLFLETGNMKDGINELELWLELEESPAVAANYVRRAMELLAQQGCIVHDQDKWFSMLLKIRLRSESGNGDVREQAKLDFNKTRQKLLSALSKSQCS